MVLDFNFDAFAHGQIKSKLWLSEVFKQSVVHIEFQKVIFLGSWYGTLPFLLLANKALFARQLVLVDLEEEALSVSRKILNFYEIEGVSISTVKTDAHSLDYHSPSFSGCDLVFNTSCEHMQGLQWYQQIPSGVRVVLQGTNMVHPEHIFPFSSLKHFREQFSDLEIQYAGQMNVEYPEMKFERYMLLGEKR